MRAVLRPSGLLLGIYLLTPAAFAQTPAEQAPPAPAVRVEVTAATDADLAAYTARLNEIISGNAAAAMPVTQEGGEVRVRFRVRRDGVAQKPILSLSSGKQVLDDVALRAVAEALPQIEPLPAAFTASFADFQARFLFNIAEEPKAEALSLADMARQRANRPKGEKKVFTNDNVRSSGSTSESGRSREASSSASAASSSKEKPPSTSKSIGQSAAPKRQEEDPEYYRQRLQPLKDQLAEVNAELDRVRYTPEERPAGLNTISNTRQNDIERLQRKKADIEKRIATIREEAASHGVSVY